MVQQLMKTEAVHLKESKRGIRETLEEGPGKGKCCDHIIISKDKRNNFKKIYKIVNYRV